MPLVIEGLDWIRNPSCGNKTSIIARKKIFLSKVGHRQ